jgi:hypothetical protein
MVVRQRASAVLSGADAGFEAVFIGGEVEARLFGLRRVEHGGAHAHGERAGSGRKELQRDVGAGGPRVDLRERLVERRGSPAAKILSLEQHLRGIGKREALQLGELALAQGEFALGVAVLPANVVPVVDMELEGNHALRNVALRRQAGEPTVSGRAAAASLGGIELHQRSRIGPRSRRALTAVHRGREGRRKNTECDPHRS